LSSHQKVTEMENNNQIRQRQTIPEIWSDFCTTLSKIFNIIQDQEDEGTPV